MIEQARVAVSILNRHRVAWDFRQRYWNGESAGRILEYGLRILHRRAADPKATA